MRKIAGPGHVSNEFADYDAITNPLGTVFTADWGNDAQAELIGVQAEMGIAEASGSNKYVLAALKGLMRQEKYSVGSFHFIGGAIKAPVAFDKDSPGTYFPALCLDDIVTYKDIAAANWGPLVTELRTWSMKYLEGRAGAVSAFVLTTWAIAANVATLTFDTSAGSVAALAAISEFYLTTGYRPVLANANAIGNIPAGEYLITGVDTVARTVTFACVANNGTAATTETVVIHTNRIVGSTTTARVYDAEGMALMSAGTSTHMANILRRSFFQGHAHQGLASNTGDIAYGVTNFTVPSAGAVGMAVQAGAGDTFKIKNIISDGISGTQRPGSETESRAQTAHLYIGGGSYI